MRDYNHTVISYCNFTYEILKFSTRIRYCVLSLALFVLAFIDNDELRDEKFYPAIRRMREIFYKIIISRLFLRNAKFRAVAGVRTFLIYLRALHQDLTFNFDRNGDR